MLQNITPTRVLSKNVTPLCSWVRFCKKANKWATEPKVHALQHMDMFYAKFFPGLWPSVRLGLLSLPKYVALLNNFAEVESSEASLTSLGCVDLISIAQGNLSYFMPATKVKGMENYKGEAAYFQSYTSIDPDLPVVADPVMKLQALPMLRVYTHVRSDVRRFPEPKRDKSSFFNYYLLDGASILPVLALEIQPGDAILDLCSAPGGKALAMLQSLYPKTVVCNEHSQARIRRLKNVMDSYIPDLKSLAGALIIQQSDGMLLKEPGGYDKVLVDVPCTNDREALSENDNNLYHPTRTRKRVELPNLQIALLLSALKSVKVGGSVVYSTCTLSPAQNEGVVYAALQEIWSTTSMEFKIRDLTHAFEPFAWIFRLAPSAHRWGLQVLPWLPSNFGPMFFSRID
ncbi:unnamed protein product, partial [Darwinula stevensoni]